MSKDGIHIGHCCAIHGCKYGDEGCPVVLQQVQQKYTCESCDIDGIKSVEEIRMRLNKLVIQKHIFSVTTHKRYREADNCVVDLGQKQLLQLFLREENSKLLEEFAGKTVKITIEEVKD